MIVEKGFPRGVAEKLEWYVYALSDPLADGQIFYVGKGSNDRAYQHAWETLAHQADEDERKLKRKRIRAILGAGHPVGVHIIRHHIPDEDTAYEVEAAVIDALLVAGNIQLTNLVSGHRRKERGSASVAELTERFAARPLHFDEDGPRVMLVQLRASWSRDISDDDLYEHTRGWWLAGPRREEVKVIAGAQGGIIRSVFRVTPGSWTSTPSSKDRVRWGCDAERDDALWEEWVGRDISHYLADQSRASFRYLPA